MEGILKGVRGDVVPVKGRYRGPSSAITLPSFSRKKPNDPAAPSLQSLSGAGHLLDRPLSTITHPGITPGRLAHSKALCCCCS